MDAAHTYFKKTVLFLATALLLAVPGLAQPSFVLNGVTQNAITVTAGIQTGTAVTVAGTLDSATTPAPITYTVGPTVYATGDEQWLSVSNLNGFTTGTTQPSTLLFVDIGSVTGQHPATVTLHATTPASGVADATITVDVPSGNPGSGTITANPNPLSLSAVAGSSAQYYVTLSTLSASPVSFTIASSATWLTATSVYSSVVSGGSIYLTVTASAASLTNNTYTGTITIQPSGSAATQIGVTFVVGTGSGSGNLIAYPGSVSWSYNTATPTVYPSPLLVTLQSLVGATSFTTSVNDSSSCASISGCWLYTSPPSGNFSSPQFTIQPNPSYMSLLTTGRTGYVYVSDYLGNTATITVSLSVNGSISTSGITWSPNPASITAALNGYTQQLTISLNSATAGTFSITGITGSGLSVGGVNTSTTSPAAASVTVYGNPTGLSANTYYGYLYVSLAPTAGGSAIPQTIPIAFTVGSGSVITTSALVTPTSLTFAYQTNSSSLPPPQSIVVSGSGTFSVATPPTYPSGETTGWLSVTPTSGTAPSSVSVNIVSPSTLAVGTYTATVAVTPYTGAAVVNVSVTLLVTASPVLVASPGSLYFTYNSGSGSTYSPVYLTASDGSADVMAVTVTTAAAWLNVSTPATTGSETTVTVNNPSSLPNGLYLGSVMVAATGAANSPVNVPVVLLVTGSSVLGGSLTLSSSSLTFSAVQNGTAPNPQTLTVSASTLTYYTASATSTGNWLSISPSSGTLNTSSNPSLTVSVNQSGLTANTYYGTITLQASGASPQYVSVAVVVSSASTSGTGNVTVTANNQAGTPSLSFTYTVGGSSPAPQTLQVVSASGTSPVSFTISSSATWLSTGVQNGASVNTPYNSPGFTISVNPSGLAASSTPYSANITIQPNGGTLVTVPVTLTVMAAATVTATPTTLTFTYQVGAADPSTQAVNVSGGGQSLGFAAMVTSGSSWLSVSPTSGTTPTTGTAALTVTVTPLEATLGAGPYTGTIVVNGTGTATGSTSINVTLTVTAPLPTIIAVKNAASGALGAVSPGEIVSIYGTAMGPAAAAYAAIDPSTGKLSTSIGGVQVLFNGVAAPLFYASATQINAVVPYEMAQFATPSVWVKFAGQTSNALQLTTATTAPGIFTQNSSGSGPGSILNQDGVTVNGPSNPAVPGSIVTVYLTGEGQTSPAGVTGKITTATLPPPQVTPAPLLPVGVLINGLPALPVYAGEAPGFAAGLMQLNVQIPLNAAAGPLSIQVLIGGNISQTGVTVSVQ